MVPEDRADLKEKLRKDKESFQKQIFGIDTELRDLLNCEEPDHRDWVTDGDDYYKVLSSGSSAECPMCLEIFNLDVEYSHYQNYRDVDLVRRNGEVKEGDLVADKNDDTCILMDVDCAERHNLRVIIPVEAISHIIKYSK